MAGPSLKDKLPLYNGDAEQACLGALLLDPESINNVLRYLRPDSFYDSANQEVFEALLAMHEKGQKPDLITLSEELRSRGSLERIGGSAYIASLASFTPSAANIEYYAKIVQEMATRRRLVHLSAETAAMAHEETKDIDAVLDEIQAKIFEISQNRRTADYHSAKEIVTETMLLIEKLSTDPSAFTGIPSGISDLDTLTNGLQKSEFIVIGARPSVGKTALALTMAAHASINLKIPVAFFSLEMSESAIMLRLIASEARIPADRIRTGRIKTTDYDSLMEAASRIYEAPLYIVDLPNMKLLELRTMARRLVLERGVKIIFIDYLTLITHENADLPRWEQIAAISRSLKALARELDIPVVALSQLKREAEGKQPTLADLRESGSIEQDADLIIFLHRDREISKTYESQSDQIETDIIVAKQRNGPTGKAPAWFKSSYAKFVNMERRDRT
ncbi:MAG TPA: replicative DNA helicase [Rectinema sp.]|jgi:replicative DNA helicase|nr:replicative DNA helicase [Rectinema sp.]HPG96670.1 replicative DNA helicase [Rectinema sp.]HPL70794.1 replicative DNA helicase [Rectinema sp.]HPN02609.1 replicative DNA helicase [Rectinema sp.]HPV58269.1 replicative DNA helicase [Rectinema sp.]